MVGKAAAAKAELRRAQKKVLEVGIAVRGVGKEKFSVENLGKVLVQADAGKFATEPEDMRALDPAHRIHQVDAVLILGLVGKRRRTDFKSGTGENELVDGIGHAVGGAVDSQIRSCDRRNVGEDIVDVHEAEAKFIHQCRRKQVSLGHVKETCVNRSIEREVEGRRAHAAG